MIDYYLHTDPDVGHTVVKFDKKKWRSQPTKEKYFVDGQWKPLPTFLYLTRITLLRDRYPQVWEFDWRRFWRLPPALTWRIRLEYTPCRKQK